MKYVIFSRISNFPFSIDAFSEKTRLTGLSINQEKTDIESIILNIVCKNNKLQGYVGGVKYMYMTKESSSNKCKILTSYIMGFYKEFIWLIRLSKKKRIAAYIIAYRSFFFVIYYRILSLMLHFPIIINIAEYHIILCKHSSYLRRINAYLFDRFSFSWADGALPISRFLNQYIKKHHPKLKQIILPAFTDFKRIEDIQIDNKFPNKYFMYCGSIAYLDIIYFILESYISLKRSDIKLLLVVNGNIQNLQEYIKKNKQEENIAIINNLKYEVLFSYYKQAMALLIPLKNDLQDIARFPHKISEYLATGRPIITTAVGEVNYYFKDMDNAYIAKTFTKQCFANVLKEVISDEKKANVIGEKGKLTGLQFFDYSQYGNLIISFIKSL
jgi:glycosyltransferase involved in cell wall biosynthesis